MRRASCDQKCVTTDIVDGPNGPTGGQIIGINLGFDFTYEHEHGISRLLAAFGIPGKPERRESGDLLGADVRTITRVPKELAFFPDLDGYAYLVCSGVFQSEMPATFNAERLDRMLGVYRDDEDLVTAWSTSDFGIRMKNDELKLGSTVLGQIYEAVQQKDAMIFPRGSGNPFGGNGGLMLIIRSRLPEETLQSMKDADEDVLNLFDATVKIENDTGLDAKLKAAGKRYFALAPQWASKVKHIEQNTQHPVVFFLNPMQQDKYEHGWYTVEQLLDWIEDKGPVIKANAA